MCHIKNMDYKNFKSLISIMIEKHKKIQNAYRLGIDLYNYEEDDHKLNKILIDEILTKEGVDWFEWYLYEKDGITGKPKKDMRAWDNDKKEICYNVKSLYDYLFLSKYFKR